MPNVVKPPCPIILYRRFVVNVVKYDIAARFVKLLVGNPFINYIVNIIPPPVLENYHGIIS